MTSPDRGAPRRPVLVAVRGGDTGLHVPSPTPSPELLHDRRHSGARTRLRLLMVEDSAADGRLVVELLREAGVDWLVERVERIKEAQAYLARHHVDCVLLDLGVLDADGLDGLRLVVGVAPEIPVVVLTRRDDDVLSSEALRHGAQDYLPKRELQPQLLARSVRYAIERKASELQLVHLAQHDALTGLANRRLLLERLEAALLRPEAVTTMFLDVDNLKLVNDTLGHDSGDQLLRVLATRMNEVVRPSDTVSRFGGDEFAIVCPGLHDPVKAGELAARLLERVSLPLILGTKVYVPSVSLGVAVCASEHTISTEEAVANADLALYAAKRHGKARYEVFNDSLRTTPRQQLQLHTELRAALVEREFEVHYQPELSLATGALVAVEALVRWEHPTRGLLTAGQFIDGVEESGLVAGLGWWVLDQVCSTLANWPGRTPPRFAVNVSPRQLSVPGFVNQVAETLSSSGIRPDQLEFEVTESALLVDDSVARVLRDLHEMGLRLAIDDFGTGFSSLNHLKLFPASTVKVDQSFVAGLGQDPVDEAIVAAVLGVATSLGLSTVAEGIETPAQQDRLHELGCELGQGYLLDRALPVGQLYATYADVLRIRPGAKPPG